MKLNPFSLLVFFITLSAWAGKGYIRDNYPVSARANHAAVTLSDGSIFFMGGEAREGVYHPATEIYKPDSKKWVKRSPLSSRRILHQSVLLQDGRVLTLGGRLQGNTTLKLVELYDPKTDRWSQKTPMPTSRYDGGFTATALKDGRVLLVGSSQTAEIYDPVEDQWMEAGMNSSSFSFHSAVTLSDGKVLVTGGAENTGTILNHVEIFDPEKNSWKRMRPMPEKRQGHFSALLPDGSVLVAGGEDENAKYSSSYVYDPKTDEWIKTQELPFLIVSTDPVTLPNGAIMIAGGFSEWATNRSALYNPKTRAWTELPAMNMPRFKHSLHVLPDGSVMAYGGFRKYFFDDAQASFEIFDFSTMTWTLIEPPYLNRASPLALELNTGKMLIFGGIFNGDFGYAPTRMVELLDLKTGNVLPGPLMKSARSDANALKLPDGRVLVTGGSNHAAIEDYVFTSTEFFNPQTGQWSWGPHMNTGRRNHSMNFLQDGRIIVIGGSSDSYAALGAINSAEIYDVKTNKWTEIPSLKVPRNYHSTVVLKDGRVAVFGGYTGSDDGVELIEIYDPIKSQWTGSRAIFKGSEAQAFVMSDGKVLIFCGHNDIGKVKIYDPKKDSMADLPDLRKELHQSVMLQLSEDEILFFVPVWLNSAVKPNVVFNYKKATWEKVSAVTEARTGGKALKLKNGGIFLMGGINDQMGNLRFHELYQMSTDKLR